MMDDRELAGHEPDVENGLRLMALLFAKIDELEARIEQLERERARRRRQAA